MGKRIVVAEDQTPQRERLGFMMKQNSWIRSENCLLNFQEFTLLSTRL